MPRMRLLTGLHYGIIAAAIARAVAKAVADTATGLLFIAGLPTPGRRLLPYLADPRTGRLQRNDPSPPLFRTD